VLGRYDQNVLNQQLNVINPKVWDTENPVNNKAVSKLYEGDRLKDVYFILLLVRKPQQRPGE